MIPTRILLLILFSSIFLLSSCFSFFRPQVHKPGQSQSSASERAKAHAKLAGGYFAINRYDIALDEAKKAVAIDPSSGPANNVYGLVTMGLGKYREAENYFNRALRADKNNPNYHNNIALLYCKTGRVSNGMNMLQKALNNKLYTRPENSFMNAGLCMEQNRDWQAAENYYTQAKKYDNTNLVAREKLTRVYLNTNRVDKAWQTINEVIIQSAPASIEQLKLGITAAKSASRFDDAEKLSKRLKEDYPSYIETTKLNPQNQVNDGNIYQQQQYGQYPLNQQYNTQQAYPPQNYYYPPAPTYPQQHNYYPQTQQYQYN